MPYEHIEPCFILFHKNHVLSYDVQTHKTTTKKCTHIVFKNERLSFLVTPNTNPNPNPNKTLILFINLNLILTDNLFRISIFLG